MNKAMRHNGGAFCRTEFWGAENNVVAAGAGDNVEVVTPFIDRQDFLSLKAVLSYQATLTDTQALLLTNIRIQHSDDPGGAGAVDFTATMTSGGAIVAGGGSTTKTEEWDVDLSGAKRYIALQYTPDLTAGAADTADIVPLAILFGSDDQPSTKAQIPNEV